MWDFSSLTRDRTHVPCIARWIHNYRGSPRAKHFWCIDLFHSHNDLGWSWYHTHSKRKHSLSKLKWLVQSQDRIQGQAWLRVSLVAQWQRISCQCGRRGFDPWVWKIPWWRKRQPTPVFFPGKFHGRRNLASYSLWGHKRVSLDLMSKQYNTSRKFISSKRKKK